MLHNYSHDCPPCHIVIFKQALLPYSGSLASQAVLTHAQTGALLMVELK